MLRPFSLVSDEIDYNPANVAEFQFPSVPKGAARCAIVGIRYAVTGDDPAAVATIEGYSTNLERLTVAGRNYWQGAAPMPLIAAAVIPGGAAIPLAFPWSNRFLGSHVPNAGMMLGQGTTGAGIAFGPADEVRMRLVRIAGDTFVNRIVLDCVQWPDDQADPFHALWKDLRYQGIGEAFFVGSALPEWPGAGAVRQLEVLPQPPSARALRRTGFRACMTFDNGNVIGTELGDAATPALNNVLATAWTSFQRQPLNQAAPLRALFGLTGLEIATGLVDMQENERSIARLDFTGSAPADPTRRIYVLHMFEGRDENAPTLEAANAIS